MDENLKLEYYFSYHVLLIAILILLTLCAHYLIKISHKIGKVDKQIGLSIVLDHCRRTANGDINGAVVFEESNTWLHCE